MSFSSIGARTLLYYAAPTDELFKGIWRFALTLTSMLGSWYAGRYTNAQTFLFIPNIHIERLDLNEKLAMALFFNETSV